MQKIICFLIITLFLGFVLKEKKTVYIGKIISDENTKNDIDGIYIDFRIDSLLIAKSIVGKSGEFKIYAPANKKYDVYYSGIGIGENFALSIKETEKDTLKFSINIPKHYIKKWGKIVCPKCLKRDQTIIIRYGLNSEIVYRKINNVGDTTYISDLNNKYYDGGCVYSDISPKYFCKRDKIKF